MTAAIFYQVNIDWLSLTNSKEMKIIKPIYGMIILI